MSLSVFLLASISLSGCTQSGMQKKVGPAPSFIASTDEHFVARGRYLAENVTGCIGCHSTLNEEVYARPVVEGSEGMGGRHGRCPTDTWACFAGNITFGIGDWTDGGICTPCPPASTRTDAMFLSCRTPRLRRQSVPSHFVPAHVEVSGSPPATRRLSVVLTKVANKTAAPPKWSYRRA